MRGTLRRIALQKSAMRAAAGFALALLVCGGAAAQTMPPSPDNAGMLRPSLDTDAAPVPITPQEPPMEQFVPPSPLVERPTYALVRISPSEAPVIDGDVSDAIWAKANVMDKFTQKGPNPGQPATERTEVRILYDQNNLYISYYNFDKTPDAIIARSMQRDGPLFTSDSIVIMIDPGLTRRDAYSFEIGASGGRRDQLEINNIQEITDWNIPWTGKARRVSDGWTAEMAIPFRDFSYNNQQTTWGFDVRRRIRHKNEQVYWSGWAPQLDFTDVSQSGNITGITDTTQGLGLDVQVYGRVSAKHNWQLPGDGAGLAFTTGGNAFYKVTPSLTNTLTVNPDFSDAPLDLRQVNTTRFSLFVPETRAFFLQDVASFEFGGRNFGRNQQDRTSQNGRPFFSRNIGLAQGTPLSLRIGDKLSGRVAGFDVGALTVMTDNTYTVPGQILSVIRATRPVLGESKMGFVFTNGDPTGLTSNTVAGVDFQYRRSNLPGGFIFQSDGYVMQSHSSTAGKDVSAALSYNFFNPNWASDLVIKQIGANFTPALGFVNRRDMRLYQGSLVNIQRYRTGYLASFESGANYLFVTDLSHRLESSESELYATARARVGDEVLARAVNSFEYVPQRFLVANTVPILPGRYGWTNWGFRVRSFDGRPFSVEFELLCCSFYNGSQIRPRLRFNYRPNAYLEFIPTYDLTMIDLPTGSVNIHLFTLDSVIGIIPDMQIALQLQYDNISGALGFQTRYRWEYEPGNEIFVSLGQSAQQLQNRFMAQTTQLSVRLGHTFRF
jgi:Carbohydrate family 9 binding domain-like